MSYLPPPLAEPPSYSMDRHSSPNHRGSRLGKILTVAVLVALAGFLAALITAIVTSGGA